MQTGLPPSEMIIHSVAWVATQFGNMVYNYAEIDKLATHSRRLQYGKK
jgi:hypothetical protein